jgi:tetratricopeptide (TPR) repeat protein
MRYRKSLAFALFGAVAALSGPVVAQAWDPAAREFDRSPASRRDPDSGGGTSVSPTQRNATLEQLNKILSASQLPPLDRLTYLNLRAFQYARLNREADAQKDVAEMAKVVPQAWQTFLSMNTAFLAGYGDRASALRLLEYGLSRKPGDTSLTIGQAEVYMQLADHARAVSLLDGAVASATAPSDQQFALYMRGVANFNVGNYAQSGSDFDGTLAMRTTLKQRLNPTLWRYAAHVRARRDAKGALAKEIGNENLYEWPGPVAKFLLGQITAGELEVAAESDENAKRANGKCLASFFVGMDAVRRGDKQRAKEQFQLAQARCSTVNNINWAASSELKRL